MGMWIVILIVIIASLAVSVIYIINRITKFRFIDYIEDKTIYKNKERTTGKSADYGVSAKRKYLEEHPDEEKYKPPKRSWLRTLIGVGVFLVTFVILYFCLSGVEAVVIVLHIALIWAIVEFIFMILAYLKIDLTQLKIYLPGICAIILVTVYLIVGNYLGSNVFITNYTFDTSKKVEPLRIAQISDTHLGVTLDKNNAKEFADQIKEQNPDVVLITGDYVDDSSSYEDMVAMCEALKTIDCKYGVYFSYGNHDKGYYDSSGRGYDTAKLEETLRANNIKILEDQTEILGNQYILIGRKDKSDKSRMPISDLVNGIDKAEFDKDYSIVLDHQPNDYDAEDKAGVDLVLSGHTHGGQLLPINNIGEIIGANDATYGHEKIDNTDFVVSSGSSAWAIRFKTGTKSEIVVIDVK